MAKYLLIAVIMVVIGGAGIFFFLNRSNTQVATIDKNTSAPKIVPNPAVEYTPDVSDSSDQGLDNDLTALEKDLAELEKNDKTFTEEVNNL